MPLPQQIETCEPVLNAQVQTFELCSAPSALLFAFVIKGWMAKAIIKINVH